jgi:hypothetical protein
MKQQDETTSKTERPTQPLSPCTSVVRICTYLFSHARDHLLAQSARSTRRIGETQGLPGATDVSRNRPLSLSSSQVITKRTPADYAEALVLTLEGQR